jgi:hypothetical protein
MPIVEAAASATLKIAAERISSYLKSADERQSNNVNALRVYADVARDTVIALEGEYDQILVDAEFCDLQSRVEATALQQRINRYLYVDMIRPLLESSALGMRRIRNLLQNDAQGFFKELWHPDRLAAVSQLTHAIESLESYIYQLGGQLRPGNSMKSGIGMHQLDEILQILQRSKENASEVEADALELRVKEFRRNRSKDGLVYLKDRIEKAYFDIREAF